MKGEGSVPKRPYRRLTADERARFIAVLRETGNRKAAAAAIGEEARSMDQRREHDPELDRAWEAAVAEAHRRFAGAKGPFDCVAVGRLNMIRRGRRGRLQLVDSGEGRWNAAVEARFFELLRETGCLRAAAQMVGFAESTVWERRRRWPAFAEALETALEEAELALEFRMAAMGSNVVAGAGGAGNPARGMGTVASNCPPPQPPPFDMDQALRFLKWREEKRRGRSRTPRARLPSIEEVTETLVRRVAAIRRHREREAEARAAREGGQDGGNGDGCQ